MVQFDLTSNLLVAKVIFFIDAQFLKSADSLFTPPTVPQEHRNQAKMIPAVFHNPDSY